MAVGTGEDAGLGTGAAAAGFGATGLAFGAGAIVLRFAADFFADFFFGAAFFGAAFLAFFTVFFGAALALRAIVFFIFRADFLAFFLVFAVFPFFLRELLAMIDLLTLSSRHYGAAGVSMKGAAMPIADYLMSQQRFVVSFSRRSPRL